MVGLSAFGTFAILSINHDSETSHTPLLWSLLCWGLTQGSSENFLIIVNLTLPILLPRGHRVLVSLVTSITTAHPVIFYFFFLSNKTLVVLVPATCQVLLLCALDTYNNLYHYHLHHLHHDNWRLRHAIRVPPPWTAAPTLPPFFPLTLEACCGHHGRSGIT